MPFDELKSWIRDSFSDSPNHNVGEPGRWKEMSDKYFGPTEALQVWSKIKQENLLPSAEKDLVFVSPTANHATHEVAIWQEEGKLRTGKTIFIVGDISDITPTATLKAAENYQTDKNQFHFLKWDADQLPLKEGSASVIWDRKGWLYYLASQKYDEGSQESLEQRENFLKALQKYYDLLEPEGLIITDAIPSGGKQFEKSTVYVITKNLGEDVWEKVSHKFLIKDIGQGTLANRVMIKK